jgi:hypothetical protein
VVTSVLDLARQEVRFYKNGQPQGVAFTDLGFAPGDTKNFERFEYV